VLETFLGGIVEIVLFMVLLHNDVNNNLIPVIRSAILGSILANLLLCLGFCFFAGGLRREEQEFDEVISEVGHGLLLMAGFGLLIPTAFYASLRGSIDNALLESKTLSISRIASVILLVAFFIYVYFQMRTHHGLYDSVLEKDEERDHDREDDLKKAKLTFTECIFALAIALTCVSLHAVFLGKFLHFTTSMVCFPRKFDDFCFIISTTALRSWVISFVLVGFCAMASWRAVQYMAYALEYGHNSVQLRLRVCCF
jgi:Ca2+:H+ antiporter